MKRIENIGIQTDIIITYVVAFYAKLPASLRYKIIYSTVASPHIIFSFRRSKAKALSMESSISNVIFSYTFFRAQEIKALKGKVCSFYHQNIKYCFVALFKLRFCYSNTETSTIL